MFVLLLLLQFVFLLFGCWMQSPKRWRVRLVEVFERYWRRDSANMSVRCCFYFFWIGVERRVCDVFVWTRAKNDRMTSFLMPRGNPPIDDLMSRVPQEHDSVEETRRKQGDSQRRRTIHTKCRLQQSASIECLVLVESVSVVRELMHGEEIQ